MEPGVELAVVQALAGKVARLLANPAERRAVVAVGAEPFVGRDDVLVPGLREVLYQPVFLFVLIGGVVARRRFTRAATRPPCATAARSQA